jgi:hypothetical protein
VQRQARRRARPIQRLVTKFHAADLAATRVAQLDPVHQARLVHPAHRPAALARVRQRLLRCSLATADAALVLIAVVFCNRRTWSRGLHLHGANARGAERQRVTVPDTSRVTWRRNARGTTQSPALPPERVHARGMTELTSLARDEAAPRRAESEDDALLPSASDPVQPASVGKRLLRAVGRLRKFAHEEPLLVQTLPGACASWCLSRHMRGCSPGPPRRCSRAAALLACAKPQPTR